VHASSITPTAHRAHSPPCADDSAPRIFRADDVSRAPPMDADAIPFQAANDRSSTAMRATTAIAMRRRECVR
jgi:hypothetical protein